MRQRTLNLGILAHVDAGKTTLTERLLFAAGVIDEVGRVDDGTTQTDSLALERRRGITIKSAVASFTLDGVVVNLIDTPGHPDFIAEVERALSVLDGAVLVISAVEGVQPQTRILMRALRRLRVPTLLFVNKIDRRGAGVDRVLEAISSRLAVVTVPMGRSDGLGTRDATFQPWSAGDPALRAHLIETLTRQDDALLADWVNDETAVTAQRLRQALVTQTRRGLVHPVYFGSAMTGTGVEPLMSGLVEFLPAASSDAEGPVSGRVFKIERGPGGDKVAYVRMFSGTVRNRELLHFRGVRGAAQQGRFGRDHKATVTGISVLSGGSWVRTPQVRAGGIGRLLGLGPVQIGDVIGPPGTTTSNDSGQPAFAPPAYEADVVPVRSDQAPALRAALAQLAEQDPLINVHQDDRGALSVSLYGEVQKEVLQVTLADEYGIAVTIRETTTICIERPIGSGQAVEVLKAPSNPFLATIGLRVDPAPPGSGLEFRLQVDHRAVPLYVYKSRDGFADAMSRYVRTTLRQGLYGWQVTDCIVTMYESNYSSPDGPPSTNGPLSTAADFRKLTPLVLMTALSQAETAVCEPMLRVSLEIPAYALGGVLAALARLGAAVEQDPQQHLALQGSAPRPPHRKGSAPQTPYVTSEEQQLTTVRSVLPAALVQRLQRQLPGLTGGEGVLESTFAGYQPVSRSVPTRPRTGENPLNRKEYLLQASRRGTGVRHERKPDE